MELAYAMTKGAVNVMSMTLANALGARGITVNAVAPGPTDTDKTPFLQDPEVQAATAAATALDRVGQPADIADAVASSPPTTRAGSPVNSSTSPAACGSDPACRCSLLRSPCREAEDLSATKATP